jgi:predicted PurR-regulated permease PerM
MSHSRLEARALQLGSVMPRTKRPTARATGHRRGTLLTAEIRPLIALATGALVVACLYWGQGVLIPVALAGLLAFLLSPVVNAIDRWGAGRATSVLVVVLLAFCLAGGVGWVLLRQLVSLADELPQYSAHIRQRVADLRGLSKGGSVEKVQRTLNEVVGEMQKDEPKATAPKPIPVIVQPPSPLLARLPGLLDVLAATGVVTVLVIFMLFERQDLRDRLIRLVGYRRLTVTTRALDEATARITRYLLVQSVINGSFGVALGIALFLLGIPYAALWGVLAAALRFIPYVGAAMAVLLPTALALAVFPGWSRALLTIAVFLALELTAYMVVEPWLFGQSAGVSPVALLVAVIFWTWLWGSVGLLLATPLTVCLIVLSKHLPSMGFLVLLMGDDPLLEPKARYYQRLLARDQDEAADIVEAYVKANDPGSVYDEVLLPALYYAKQDCEREKISEADAEFVAHATREIVEELDQDRPSTATRDATAAEGSLVPRGLLLLCPARDEIDGVALAIAAQLVDATRWQVEILGPSMLTSEVAQLVEERRPALVCIGSVAPGGVSHTRHLCKRLRARCPDLTMLVGRFGLHDESADEQQQLVEGGADHIAPTMRELARHIAELSLLAETAGSEGGEAQEMRVPAARHPLLDPRPV